MSTSIELYLGIEIPVAASNISGNAEEGSFLIKNREQLQKYHDCDIKIDIADSKYDIIDNCGSIREHGSIRILDYNIRNEHSLYKISNIPTHKYCSLMCKRMAY